MLFCNRCQSPLEAFTFRMSTPTTASQKLPTPLTYTLLDLPQLESQTSERPLPSVPRRELLSSRGFCAFSIGGWDYPAFQAGFGQLLLKKQTASKYQKRLDSCIKRRKLSSARAGAPGPNDLVPDYEERVATLDDPHRRLERFLSFHTIEQLKHRAYMGLESVTESRPTLSSTSPLRLRKTSMAVTTTSFSSSSASASAPQLECSTCPGTSQSSNSAAGCQITSVLQQSKIGPRNTQHCCLQEEYPSAPTSCPRPPPSPRPLPQHQQEQQQPPQQLQQEQHQHMLAAGLLLLGGEASNAALLRTFSPTTPAPLVLREAETPAVALISTPQLECDLNTTQQAATALLRLSSELAQPQKNGAGHKSQPCMEQEPVPTTSNSQQRRTLRSRCTGCCLEPGCQEGACTIPQLRPRCQRERFEDAGRGLWQSLHHCIRCGCSHPLHPLHCPPCP